MNIFPRALAKRSASTSVISQKRSERWTSLQRGINHKRLHRKEQLYLESSRSMNRGKCSATNGFPSSETLLAPMCDHRCFVCNKSAYLLQILGRLTQINDATQSLFAQANVGETRDGMHEKRTRRRQKRYLSVCRCSCRGRIFFRMSMKRRSKRQPTTTSMIASDRRQNQVGYLSCTGQ